MAPSLEEILKKALQSRPYAREDEHTAAFRILAGFYEGCPDLVADVYGRTMVLFGYGKEEQVTGQLMNAAQQFYQRELPWLAGCIQKNRVSRAIEARHGLITFGQHPEDCIEEQGIWYALNLMLSQDASFYLDTRALRQWLSHHAAGKSMLNLFAYTGALGVAALAGGAAEVVQVDRSHKFMELALRSCELNRLDVQKMTLMASDCFPAIGNFKRSGKLFDIVVIDPPFFSTTEKGTVDQVNEFTRMINKARPLVKDSGHLLVINNALFLKGIDFRVGLDELCRGGYLEIEEILPVPEDVTGYPETRVSPPPVDPAPFNHPTKMVILKVRRKDANR